MIYKKLLLNLILLFLAGKGICQGQTGHQDLWIPKIMEYRDYLLRKNPNGVQELKQLLDKWETINTTEEEKTDLTLNVLKLLETGHLSNAKIIKKAVKNMPESNIAKQLTSSDLETIKKNAELLDMIYLGLLKSAYPFQINSKTLLLEELDVYDLHNTDKTGEIGSGSGAFSLLLNRIHPNMNLYINEMDKSFLKYIKIVLDRNVEMFTKSNIFLIKGNKKGTNLEGKQLDKIIIRNSFHHFSKKTKMLESIKKSLKPGGALYVKESVLELDKDQDICKYAMRKRELIKIIESNGFRLIQEIELSEQVLLKFEIK